MAAELIDGRAIAQQVRDEVRAEVEAWVNGGGQRPGLATVLVGDDPASAVYVGGKQRASAEVGIAGFDHRLPHDAAHADVEQKLRELNEDPEVSGILLQLPTPPQVDGPGLTTLIDPGKDVDGLTPVSAGLLAQLLLAANATVTVCHSRTRDLPEVCRRADVLVAAVGRAEMVRGDWVKRGATVIDVGINRTDA